MCCIEEGTRGIKAVTSSEKNFLLSTTHISCWHHTSPATSLFFFFFFFFFFFSIKQNQRLRNGRLWTPRVSVDTTAMPLFPQASQSPVQWDFYHDHHTPNDYHIFIVHRLLEHALTNDRLFVTIATCQITQKLIAAGWGRWVPSTACPSPRPP